MGRLVSDAKKSGNTNVKVNALTEPVFTLFFVGIIRHKRIQFGAACPPAPRSKLGPGPWAFFYYKYLEP